MLVSEYDTFVQNSDQSVGKPDSARLEIALYGLAAELGSLVSAIKKLLLSEAGDEDFSEPNEEIIEELGDVVWYCFSLARIANPGTPVNIFLHDIANLKREIGASNARAARIGDVLTTDKRNEFLRNADQFPKLTRNMKFDDYQSLAFLTARTKDRTLIEVCLAVLWQLVAELFRNKLPPIEVELNQTLPDRDINDVLGEIAWHVSALASTFGLGLGAVARANIEKVSYRLNRTNPTPPHDTEYPQTEQIPRRFEVSFVTVGKGRSRMYLDGQQLGDDLTDNSYADDGYRFHDIMHLANVAKLAWSPVLRSLMGRKRKSQPAVDEVEDGARAQIVEEAVIKAIHSEGARLASLRATKTKVGPIQLFPTKGEITFRFLKFIRAFVSDLEVEKNRYWEWEDAILEGYAIFDLLRREGQGTVAVDVLSKTISFRPEVAVNLRGAVAGVGTATTKNSVHNAEQQWDIVAKRAILNALELADTLQTFEALNVTRLSPQRVSVKAKGVVQETMWSRKVIAFRTSFDQTDDLIHCTAVALSDPKDS